MGSEMRLTGLASGFDWQPLVDRLIELESVPKQRLEAEKVQNQGKISELGVLKSRLNTLNSSATSLQNEDLFNARSVGVSSASANGFSANAEAGAMTGEFNISVESMATRTEMSSRNRNFGRLAGGLDLSASIKDLALFSDITPGTFTISGRTFSITNLNASLQDIIDEINTTFAGVTGVNPESDNTGITLEYDAVSDKFHFDTNALSPLAAENIPVLGSTTDTSNFLKAVGLLDRNLAYRNADFEAASNVSIFSPGDGSKAWLHGDDPSTSGHLNFAAFNGTLYERIKFENEYNPAHYHNGHISGVGYLKVPDDLGKTFQKNKQNSNGHLQLIHGSKQFLSNPVLDIKPRVGEFYFFPAYLTHTVYPFINKTQERRSISFNAYIDDNIFKV